MGSSVDEEFEDFVRASWPRLRRAAYLLTHDEHDAEDVAQSALARSYANWGRVRREGASAYVHRALVNAYIDSTRRRRPVPVASPQERADGGERPHPVEDRSELVDLLAPLSARERSIVVWRYYLDAPEREVAEHLGIAPGTVRSTASRALARLRDAAATPPTKGQDS